MRSQSPYSEIVPIVPCHVLRTRQGFRTHDINTMASSPLPGRNFRSSDYPLGTQSHANPIGLAWASRSDHFLPQNRLVFAFHVRMDGESKPD
jgi:hypothetical protein